MKRSKTYLLLITLLLSSVGSAQLHNNFIFFTENMAVINPAVTGSNGKYVAVSKKYPWNGDANAPRMASLVTSTDFKNNAAWGFNYIEDRVYIESRVVVSVNYSYRIQTTYDSYLQLGIKVGGFSHNYDLDNINRLTSEVNPVLQNWKNLSSPVFGFGGYFRTGDTFIGVSLPNIISQKQLYLTEGIQQSILNLPQYYLTAGSSMYLSYNLIFEPRFMLRVLSNGEKTMSCFANFTIENLITVGAGISNSNNFGGLFMYRGMGDVSFGFAYELGQRNDQALKIGASEIVVRVKFD